MSIWLPVLLFTLLIEFLVVLIFAAARLFVPQKPVDLTLNTLPPITCQTGDTLLQALYAQEIFIPSACGGKGTCGYCKVQVHVGGGEILPTEMEFLSRQERQAGFRLACQIKLSQDLCVTLPSQFLDAKEHTATITSTTSLTHDIKEISFSLHGTEPFRFKMGQYIQVKIPSEREASGFLFRAYSIASPEQHSAQLTLNVKRIPGGVGSTWLHTLTPGETLSFTGPYGEWELDPDPTHPLILIGGGVGMAPMRSIVLTLLERGAEKPLYLYFGARSGQDLLYHNLFASLAETHPSFSFIPALSEPHEDEPWDGERGFIHTVFSRHFTRPGFTAQAFLCGPPPMIDAAMESLDEKGLAETSIFYDKF